MFSIITWLSAVPALFWSAIFGSLLTLGGVLIIDRGNTKRQKQQLENAAEEAKRARAAGLRKEVYLKAAAELTKGMESLGRLPVSDIADPKFSAGLSDFYETAAQFQLVAELSTSILMTKVLGEVSAAHLKAMSRIPSIHQEQIAANEFEERHLLAKNRFIQIIEELRRLERSGLNTSKEHQGLSDDLIFWKQELQLCLDKKAYHLNIKTKLTIDAGTALLQDLIEISKSQLDLFLQMRMELGFESDATLYRNAIKKSQDKLQKSIRDVVEKMQ